MCSEFPYKFIIQGIYMISVGIDVSKDKNTVYILEPYGRIKKTIYCRAYQRIN